MNLDKKKRALIEQFIRFCLVGGVGAVVNYGLFFLTYRYLSIYYILASGIGFISSIFVAFFLNRSFTFKQTSREGFNSKIIKYFIVNCVTLVIGLLFLKLFVDILNINVYIANLCVIGIQAVSNFTGSKLFVFK